MNNIENLFKKKFFESFGLIFNFIFFFDIYLILVINFFPKFCIINLKSFISFSFVEDVKIF